MIKIVPILKKAWNYTYDLFDYYFQKRGNVLAKGIAYSILVSTIPFLILAFYTSTIFMYDASVVHDSVRETLSELVPPHIIDLLLKHIMAIVNDNSWDSIGIVGAIGLIFVPHGLFASLEDALTKVMDSPSYSTPFHIKQLFYFIITIFIVGLFFISSYISIGISTAFNFIDFITVPSGVYWILSKTFSFSIIWFVLLIVYKVCYHKSMNRKYYFGVSFGVAFLWQIINYLGASIITVSGRSKFIYGVIAGGTIYLLWAYIFSMLLLLGGIIISKHSEN